MIDIKKPKLVCFDWDNTIVNTNPLAFESLNIFFRELGVPEIEKSDMVGINNLVFEDYIRSCLEKANVNYDEKEFRERYARIYDSLKVKLLEPILGAFDVIKKLNSLGIYQAVISNKGSHIVNVECERFGFSKYINYITGPQDAGFFKPNIGIFEFTVKKLEEKIGSKLNLEEGDVWFFGDSTIDYEFSKIINARFFGIGDQIKNTIKDDKNATLLSNYQDFKEINII